MKLINNQVGLRINAWKSIFNLNTTLSLIIIYMLGITTFAHAETTPIRTGFDSNILAPNDDQSTELVDLGFTINFFGNFFSKGYVNNNGNMTFDAPLGTYTPFGLSGTNTVIIAPFFADVDTAVEGSSPVTYGRGTVGTRQAFAANWLNVACYTTPSGGFNSFQLVLIDRSDIGVGDFDIEFNYEKVDWETGTASGGNSVCEGGNSVRIGYSNGTSTSFELAGSGIAGAFLDTNLDTGLIHNNRNSLESGRYIFEVRNGDAPVGQHIAGTIFGNNTSNPLPSSLVQICTANQNDLQCNLTRSNSSGQYIIDGLPNAEYEIKAFPPVNTNFQTGTIGPILLAGSDLDGQDIILQGPQPIPDNTSILPSSNSSGIPSVYWHNTLTLSTVGCPEGTASYTITHDDSGLIIASGNMQEEATNPGVYTANVAPLAPNTGYAIVAISILCLDGSSIDIVFSIYIDPSGIVKDTLGNPISGASVTLFRSDSSAGPFLPVENGSDVMSPANRNNPSQTDNQGLFGWDVVTGFYKVRAAAEGCVSPLNVEQDFVETEVLPIPPPVTDLQLTLDCGEPPLNACDVNRDGFVSRQDVLQIYGMLRETVLPSSLGDLSEDGMISAQDIRGCILQCSFPRCAEPIR